MTEDLRDVRTTLQGSTVLGRSAPLDVARMTRRVSRLTYLHRPAEEQQ